MKNVPYSFAISSLINAMIYTRPDITYAIGALSRFCTNPRKEYWTLVKWILRYLKDTTKRCLNFGNEEPIFVGYSDTDRASDIDSQ